MFDTRLTINNDDKDDILAREIIQENSSGKDSDITLVDDFLDEIDLRLEQVKIYYPIIDILRRGKSENELLKFVPELCFLVLSYLIYEGKMKHRGITFENLEIFLYKALKEILKKDLEQKTIRELTSEILDALQNSGRNFILKTYSFKAKVFNEKYIKFLEIKQSDAGVLQYYITEQGVDFYLKTKEFPDETKITINLLLFQKQMEKGAFGFAYETVRRLNMEVQKKKDKKYTLLEALMYGRLDLGEAYNSYHESIVMQFEEESELFNLAMKNVNNAFNEYVERMNNDELTIKEERAFILIKIIEKEIGRAQTLHTELLKEAVSFTKEYDNALGIRRKAIFTERFNFQGEFEKIISNDDKPEILKYLFEPLLNPKLEKAFNPLEAFEPQRVLKIREEESDVNEIEASIDRETFDQKIHNRVRGNFVFYAARLLEALNENGNQISLQDFCNNLKKRYSEDALYNGDFLSFIIEMNREKKIGEYTRTISFSNGSMQMDEDLESIQEVFIKASLEVQLDGIINQVTVTSFPAEELELLPGLKITNILFAGERRL